MEKSKLPCIKTFREELIHGNHLISDKEYKLLRYNYQFIMTMIWINEKYSMILDNYYEFIAETKILEEKLFEATDKREMIQIGQRAIVCFNRKLSNLLCSVRMYIDQTQHDLSRLKYEKCTKEDFHGYTSEAYDASVGYQIMELLRNYIQHQGLILDGLTFIRPFEGSSEKYLCLILEIDYKKLKKIERYKNKIFLDSVLEGSGANTFNLLWFSDEYVTRLDEVHKRLIDSLSPQIQNAQKEIEKILKKYYEDIPNEVGVFGTEKDILLQHNYVLQASINIPKLDNCYDKKIYFKTSDCLRGNFEQNRIRYNM